VVQALATTTVQPALSAATMRARAAAKAAVVASAPATPTAASRSSEAAHWARAEQVEYDNLFTPRANQTMPALSKVPKSKREHDSITVRCKCVYKHQFSDNGCAVTGYKCRYTYCGSGESPYPQWHGSSTSVTCYDGESSPPDTPNRAPTSATDQALAGRLRLQRPHGQPRARRTDHTARRPARRPLRRGLASTTPNESAPTDQVHGPNRQTDPYRGPDHLTLHTLILFMPSHNGYLVGVRAREGRLYTRHSDLIKPATYKHLR
jgi:hypothetical protein